MSPMSLQEFQKKLEKLEKLIQQLREMFDDLKASSKRAKADSHHKAKGK